MGSGKWEELRCEGLTRLVLATGVLEGRGCFVVVVCPDRPCARGTSIWPPSTFERCPLRGLGRRIAEGILHLRMRTDWGRIELLASQDLVCYYDERFLPGGVALVYGVGFLLGLRPFR